MPRKEIFYFGAIVIAAIIMIAAFHLLTGTEARIGLIGFDGPRMMLLAKANRQTGIRVAGISPDRLIILGQDLPSHTRTAIWRESSFKFPGPDAISRGL